MKQDVKTMRVLIANKSFLFCRGLCTLLKAEQDLQVVDVASTADEVLAKASLYVPDVLVVSVEVLRSMDPDFRFALRQAMANGSILALTDDDNEECLDHAITAGAKGYMLKSSAPGELANGIRQIVHSNSSQNLQTSKVIPDLKALAAQNAPKPQGIMLTVRESEVVRMLAAGKTVREVADDLSLSVKTIEAHKLNLMRKLDIHHRADLIAYAAQHGMTSVG